MAVDCIDEQHAHNRAETQQTALLRILAQLEEMAAQMDGATDHLPAVLADSSRRAVERISYALEDLRAAEKYLGGITTARRQQRATARERAAAACES
jgi:hypothetical protein